MARNLEKVPSQNYSLYAVDLKRPFFRGDYDVASLETLDFYEICRNQLLKDYFTEKIELEYAGNAYHFWFKKDAFLAEEIKVSINKYKRPKIMYIPSERNVLSVVKNIEELDNLPTMLRLLRRRYLQGSENLKVLEVLIFRFLVTRLL